MESDSETQDEDATAGFEGSVRTARSRHTVITVAGAKGGVGKTVLASNLAIYLATIGRKVVLLDADETGANVHTLVGNAPTLPLGDEGQGRQEQGLVLQETPIAGLSVVHGGVDEATRGTFCRTTLPELASQLGALGHDYVVVDLGSSLQRPLVDFFLQSEVSLFATLPEPTALENTYRFVRHAFARHLRHSASDQPTRRRIVQWLRKTGNAPAPLDLARRLDAAGDPLGDLVRAAMETFRFRFVLNQARVRADLELGDSMTTVVGRRFGIDLDYVGYIDFDDTVWSCIRNRRPLLVESPGTKASKSIEKIARRLLSLDSRRVQRRDSSVPKESHHDLLEVERGTTDEEIRRSYKRLREVYSADALCCYGLYDHRSLEVLRARLEEAYDILLDPARRRPYELSVFPEPREPERGSNAPEDRDNWPPAPTIRPDSEFTGDLLRAVRESQGLEVGDIARRTKIGLRHLIAIEADDYPRLPAPVYVGGFVTEVAKCLKLDPPRVSRSYLRRYERFIQQREKA